MNRGSIKRRLAALEEAANPAVSTWADLVAAVEEGRDPIILSPAMQDLFDSALSERGHDPRFTPPP
jgi:hypothetical protein